MFILLLDFFFITVDPSADIFDDVESLPVTQENNSLPSPKEEAPQVQPSFQGSFSSDMKEK